MAPGDGFRFQTALHRLWLLAERHRMSAILTEFKAVHDSVRQSLEHGNANRNSQLILNDFYFTVFDPVRHFSLEVNWDCCVRGLWRLTSTPMTGLL